MNLTRKLIIFEFNSWPKIFSDCVVCYGDAKLVLHVK